jgi:cell division septal protein FtsQ
MKIRIIITATLLIFLTTILSEQKIFFSKLNINKIVIENNILIQEKDLKNSLEPIYNKSLLFLESGKIEEILIKHNLIESFKIKKKYPNTLKIKIFEKKPIAILINKKRKFYLSEKIELIEFNNLFNYQNLPYILGSKDDFKIFYEKINKIDFPLKKIKKYIFYETNRWDLETTDDKIIKLPSKNYTKSLINYLNLASKKEFKKYNIYDYRINDQLILK